MPSNIEQQQLIIDLLKQELLDEDGYPTEAALRIVENWPYENIKGWFEFVKSIWSYTDWGWKEIVQDHDYRAGKKVLRYKISTAGWSGNESIVKSMQGNDLLWHITWVESRRGGHYVFEVDITNEHPNE